MINCTCKYKPDRKDFDIEKIDLDCQAAYDLIETGATKGIFQVDSYLGRQWGQKVKPRNIEELSDLISLVRPGCLESGMSERYVRYKESRQEPEYAHPSLKPILSSTYGQMIYQEQIMEVCWRIAGMDLKQSDEVRRATGKKLPELMAKQKDVFIRACLTERYTKDFAENIWGQIEKSADYSFNKSHGISYALMTYRTAFLKAHFLQEFLVNLLNRSSSHSDPQKEIIDIIADCWRFGVKVSPPTLSDLSIDFKLIADKHIRFGIRHMKGIGDSKSKCVTVSDISSDSLSKSLISLVSMANKDVALSLIKCGLFDSFTSNRNELLAKTEILLGLTDKELTVMKELVVDKTIVESWPLLIERTKNKRRRQTLEKMIADISAIKVTTEYYDYVNYEHELYGVPLSDKARNCYAVKQSTHKCAELNFCAHDDSGRLFARINDIRAILTKAGKKMAYVSLCDDTGVYNGAVVFPSQFFKLSEKLYEGCYRDVQFSTKGNSIIVQDVH